MIIPFRIIFRHYIKLQKRKIELYFIKIFTQILISCYLFPRPIWHSKVLPWQLALESQKMYLKFWLHNYSTNYCMS